MSVWPNNAASIIYEPPAVDNPVIVEIRDTLVRSIPCIGGFHRKRQGSYLWLSIVAASATTVLAVFVSPAMTPVPHTVYRRL